MKNEIGKVGSENEVIVYGELMFEGSVLDFFLVNLYLKVEFEDVSFMDVSLVFLGSIVVDLLSYNKVMNFKYEIKCKKFDFYGSYSVFVVLNMGW